MTLRASMRATVMESARYIGLSACAHAAYCSALMLEAQARNDYAEGREWTERAMYAYAEAIMTEPVTALALFFQWAQEGT